MGRDRARPDSPTPSLPTPRPGLAGQWPSTQQYQAGRRPWDSTPRGPGRRAEGARAPPTSAQAARRGLHGRHHWEWGVQAAPRGRRRQPTGTQRPQARRRRRREVQAAGCSAGPARGPQPTPGGLPCGFSSEPWWEAGGGGPPGRGGGGGGTGKGRGGLRPPRDRGSAEEHGELGDAGPTGQAEGRGPLGAWACRSGHRITRRRPLYALPPQPPP